MEKICGIYKITNLLNNKCYIGQSVDIIKRFKQHKKTGNLDNNVQQLYIDMHNNFESFEFKIIEECIEGKLNEREEYWVNYYNSIEEGYNLQKGGGFIRTDEAKKRRSNAGKKGGIISGKHLHELFTNEETRKQMLEYSSLGGIAGCKTNWSNPEYRNKMSNILRERNLLNWSNPEYKEKMKNICSKAGKISAIHAQEHSDANWNNPEIKEKMLKGCVNGGKAHLGTKYINKDGVNKIVPKEDVEKYLLLGYKVGRLPKK